MCTSGSQRVFAKPANWDGTVIVIVDYGYFSLAVTFYDCGNNFIGVMADMLPVGTLNNKGELAGFLEDCGFQEYK